MALLENPSGDLGGSRTVVTTAGTRVQLTTTSEQCNGVSITAETDNTGLIAVGDIGVVAAEGTQDAFAILNAGDNVFIPVNDPSNLYIDSTVSGDGVAYGWLIP